MFTMKHRSQYRLFLWGILMILISLGAQTSAKDSSINIPVLKAGFSATPDPEKFQDESFSPPDEIPFSALQKGEVFFWTEVQCSEQCQNQFKSDEVVIIHRWVRDYGSKVFTTKVEEFTLQALQKEDNLLRSAQTMKGPGAWYVEIKLQTLDGQKLCISSSQKDEPDICKFRLRIKG